MTVVYACVPLRRRRETAPVASLSCFPSAAPPFEYYARVLCRQRLVGASITHRKGQWREPSYLLPPEQQAAPGVA